MFPAAKLLSRIVAPEEVMESTNGKKKQDVASELHDYTYGESNAYGRQKSKASQQRSLNQRVAKLNPQE